MISFEKAYIMNYKALNIFVYFTQIFGGALLTFFGGLGIGLLSILIKDRISPGADDSIFLITAPVAMIAILILYIRWVKRLNLSS